MHQDEKQSLDIYGFHILSNSQLVTEMQVYDKLHPVAVLYFLYALNMHNVNLPNCGYARKLASARSIQFLDRPKHQEDLVMFASD